VGPDGPGQAALQRLGLTVERVRQRLETSGRRGRPRGATQELAYTSHAKRLIEMASKEAREAGTGLSADQLLLAALVEPRGTMSSVGGGRRGTRAGSGRWRQGPQDPHAPSPAGLTSSTDAGGGPNGHRPVGGRRLHCALDCGAGDPMAHDTPGGRAGQHRPGPRGARGVWVFLTACLGVLPLAGYMAATEPGAPDRPHDRGC
jgi:hypothetical protein